MASPLALGSIGATAAGAALDAKSMIAQADATAQGYQSQSQMYMYQAGIAQLNERIALQNRDYALAAGETEAGMYGMKARQQGGAIKAGQAASGLDVNSGSAVDVQRSQKQVADMDMAQIRNNAARAAYGYAVESKNQKAQGAMYTAASRNSTEAAALAKQSGAIDAKASLVSGASSVASKWLQAGQMGIAPFTYGF